EATVTIDGERFEGVGIRKKGFLGSLSDTRPSIKVHFEKFGAQARFRGLERMTFNNNRQDNSQMRQCVAYQAFAAAGVPAPRCSLAHVSVNGQSLGVYSHIESMKKAFVRRHFEDDEGPFFEGQFSDFRDGWLGTFAQKTNEDMPQPAAIEDLTAILQLPDDELFAALGARVDLANFYRFWTMEAVTSHWDGYSGNANNYYFYDDPTTGRVFFMPWGTDGTFQRSPFGAGAAASVQIAGLLNRRLYLHPEGGAIYVRALRESLAAFDEAALLARMDQIAALVRPALHAEQAGGFDRAVADLRTYIGAQRQRITAEIANGPARVGGQLRAPFCQPQVGELDLRFDTTWGTYPGDPFAAGTGALVGTLNGMPIAGGPVGSQAGTEPAGADRGQAIVLGAITQGQNRLQVRVRIEPAVLGEAELAVDDNLVSVVLQQVAFGRTTNVGLGYRGTLTFEQQGDAPGAPVVGRVVVDLMRPR
ncbi:MAG: CotH kinase family protein, partial [Myxococcales bacterium]|nr:CotH kinase family protein [Myxococcales bacterium]